MEITTLGNLKVLFAYEDHASQLWQITRQTCTRYQLTAEADAQEVHSIILQAFLKCLPRYDPSRGASLSTFLYTAIWREALQDIKDFCNYRYNAVPIAPPDDSLNDEGGCALSAHEELVSPVSPKDSLFLLMLGEFLEADARFVIDCVINTPQALEDAFQSAAPRSRQAYLRTIVNFLKQESGWSMARARDAVKEIKAVLRLLK